MQFTSKRALAWEMLVSRVSFSETSLGNHLLTFLYICLSFLKMAFLDLWVCSCSDHLNPGCFSFGSSLFKDFLGFDTTSCSLVAAVHMVLQCDLFFSLLLKKKKGKRRRSLTKTYLNMVSSSCRRAHLLPALSFSCEQFFWFLCKGFFPLKKKTENFGLLAFCT